MLIEGSCVRLTLKAGVIISANAVFTVNNTGGCAAIAFDGGVQTISGSGRIAVNSTGNGGSILLVQNGAAVTVAPGITMAYGPGATGNRANFRIDAGCSLTNLGAIQMRQSNATLAATGAGTFTNNGSIDATAGSLLLETNSWSSSGTIQATNAAVTFAGSWLNAGSVSLNNSSWTVGGIYTGLGTIQRTGGTVQLAALPQSTNILAATAVTGDLILTGLMLSGIELQSSGGAKFILSGPATLTACTIDGTLNVCGDITLKAGLKLKNGGVLTFDGCPAGQLFASTSQSISGSGKLIVPETFRISNSSTVTIENGVTIQAIPSRSLAVVIDTFCSLINQSVITHPGPGTLTFSGGGGLTNPGSIKTLGLAKFDATITSLLNSGTIEVGGAGTFSQSVNWQNPGYILINGSASLSGWWTNTGTIEVKGSTTAIQWVWSNLGQLILTNTATTVDGNYSSLGQFLRTGGSMTFNGTYTGTTLEANAQTGDLTLGNLQLTNCEIRAVDGASINATGMLNMQNCTLKANLLFTGCAVISVTSNLTLANSAVLTFNRGPAACTPYAIAFVTSTASLLGTGEIVFLGDSGILSTPTSSTVTIASGVRLRIAPEFTKPVANIAIGSSGKLKSFGTLSFEKAVVAITIGSGTFENWGTLNVAAGTLDIQKLNGNIGALSVGSSGILKVNGPSYTINTSPAFSPGARLELNGSYAINASLNFVGSVVLLNGTWSSNASITALNSTLTFGGAWTNSGLIDVSGSTVTFGGNWTNSGTLNVRDSVLTLSGNIAFGTHQFSNNVLTIAGTFPSNVTLQADGTTGDITLGSSTFTSSTLRSRDGARFVTASGHAITLNTCTLDGELAVTGCGAITISSGITLQNYSVIRLKNSCAQGLIFPNVGTITGSGEIIADGASSATAQFFSTSSAVTVASGVTLRVPAAAAGAGVTQVLFTSSGGNLINQGSILNQAPRRELSISGPGHFSNAGLVEASGGPIRIFPSFTDNISGSRITGGTWHAINAPINFQGKDLRQIGAGTEIVLEGALGDIPQLLALDSNSGALHIRTRTHPVKPASVFTNSGILDLAPDATLAVTGRAVLLAAGTLRTQIAGLSTGQIGRITATAGATLNGKLQGSFAPSYFPQPGDETSPLITAPLFSGSFTSTCFDANAFGLGVQPLIDTGVSPNELSLLLTASSGTLPILTLSPSDASASPNAMFNAAAAPSNATYQWKRNNIALANGPTGTGSTISGAQSATLTITHAQPSDVGLYTVAITNSCGTLTSNPAQLRLCPGDLNSDALVDDADFVIFLAGYNILDCADPSMPAICPGDLNQDGLIDDADFQLFVGPYNELICP